MRVNLFCSGPVKKEKTFVIPFHGEKIKIIEKKGQILVPLKQFCDILGVDWSAQLKKINKNPVLNKAMFKTKVITRDDKHYNTSVLPLSSLQHFLFSFSLSRFVLSEQKCRAEIIKLYQKELLDHINNYLAELSDAPPKGVVLEKGVVFGPRAPSSEAFSKPEVVLKKIAPQQWGAPLTKRKGLGANAALPFSEAVKCLLDFMALKGFIYVIRLVNNNYYVGCSGSTIAHRFHRHSVIRKKTFLYFDHIFFVKDIRVINVYDVEKRLHMALSQETGLDLGSIRNSGSIGFNCSNQALVRALFYTKINEEAFLMPSLKVIGELSDFVKKSM